MLQLLTATWNSVIVEAASESHPNEMPFKGVLLQLDEPSTKPPNGARGHRIYIPTKVAKNRLQTLVGMGVNLADRQDKHSPQRKVGVIESAWIKGKELWIKGKIWKKDFPDAEEALRSKKLGMSFEGSDVQIEDAHASVWKVADLFFTGAALLLKTAAAYSKTEALAASAASTMYAELYKESGGSVMAKGTGSNQPTAGAFDVEAFTRALMAAVAPLTQAVQAQTAAVTGMQASFEELQTSLVEVDAKSAKKKSDDDDDDGDDDDADDDDEDDLDATGDDDKPANVVVKACTVCGGKGCKDCGGMKASEISDDADDADELEQDSAKPLTQNNKTGELNKDADDFKGDKKTVTANARLRRLVREVAAENTALRARMKAMRASAERIAEKTTRRSTAVHSIAASTTQYGGGKPTPLLAGLLNKNHVDVSIFASGDDHSGMSMDEFNKLLEGANLEIPQRIALKIEAERLGYISGTAN
jgi:hypothetical protein